jgi:hypothetical protein
LILLGHFAGVQAERRMYGVYSGLRCLAQASVITFSNPVLTAFVLPVYRSDISPSIAHRRALASSERRAL